MAREGDTMVGGGGGGACSDDKRVASWQNFTFFWDFFADELGRFSRLFAIG